MALSKIPPAGHAQYVGARNLIINGAMQVAQRGTSATGITSGTGYNTVDRFQFVVTNAGTYTIAQSTTTPDGFGFSTKIDCTTADTSVAADHAVFFQQRIEGQNLQVLQKGTSSAKKHTLSFYVKSNKTGTFTVHIKDNDNSRSISKTYTIDSANTWEIISNKMVACGRVKLYKRHNELNVGITNYSKHSFIKPSKSI